MDEQAVILKFIREKTEEINTTIEKVTKEIELLKEYRTRLISDVVTGKIDVRGIEVEDILEQDMELDDVDEELEEHEEAFDVEECEV